MFSKNIILIYSEINMQNQQNEQPAGKANFSNQIKSLTQNSLSEGRLQLKMFIVFIMASIFSNLQINSSKLLYVNPVFECQGTTGKQTQAFACQHIEICTILQNQTVTAQIHLYCGQRTNERIIILSASAFANWFGIIFAAIISDRFGRKLCFCFSILLLNAVFIIQYAGIQMNFVSLLVTSEFLIGFSGIILYINFLVLSTRFFVKDLYEIATLWWLLSGGIAQIIIAVLNMIFQDWKAMFYLYSVGILITSIFSLLVLYQDPIYLFDTGKYQQCRKIIKQIGAQNCESQEQTDQKLLKLDGYIRIKQEYIRQNYEDNNTIDWRQLIRKDLIIIALILGLVGGCYYTSNLSLDFSIQNLALSYNHNLLIVGLANIVGYWTAVYILRIEEKRKRGFIAISIISGIIGFMFAFKFCTENSVVESICVTLFKISICWISVFFVRLKVDLLPDKYQGTVVGVIEFIANFGKLFAPALAQKSLEHQLSPIFTINIIHLVLGTLPVFMINEQKVEVDQVNSKQKNDE